MKTKVCQRMSRNSSCDGIWGCRKFWQEIFYNMIKIGTRYCPHLVTNEIAAPQKTLRQKAVLHDLLVNRIVQGAGAELVSFHCPTGRIILVPASLSWRVHLCLPVPCSAHKVQTLIPQTLLVVCGRVKCKGLPRASSSHAVLSQVYLRWIPRSRQQVAHRWVSKTGAALMTGTVPTDLLSLTDVLGDGLRKSWGGW